MTIMPQTNLDERYLLLRRLAFGGMGEVWEGTDVVLDRAVAVKILRAELADDDAFRRRFRAEARVAGRVPHPGIASVYDYGETSVDGKGLAYLVMELVPGEALSAILAREGALGTDRSLDVVAQAARALHAAHERGVIHRDVKPANLMVTPDGRVKVTDFGIARPDDHEPLTATGQVMGTAHYLAPELARGRAATSASDIYALGVVMYECLAGRRPFEGDDQIGVATAHLAEEPPPLPGTIAPEVRALVAAAMEKEPARRIGGADVFAAAAEGLRLRPRGDAEHYGAGGAPTAVALGGVGLAGGRASDPATPVSWPGPTYPASSPQPSHQQEYPQTYPPQSYPPESYPGASPFPGSGGLPAPGTAAANGALLAGGTPPGGPDLYRRPATTPLTLPGTGGVGRRGRGFSLPLAALVLLVLLVLIGTAIAQLRPSTPGTSDTGTPPSPVPTTTKRGTSPSPSTSRTPTAGGTSTGPVRPPVSSSPRSPRPTTSPTRSPSPTASVSPSSPSPTVSTPAASGTTSTSPSPTPTASTPTPTPGGEGAGNEAEGRAAGVVRAASGTGDTGGSGSTT